METATVEKSSKNFLSVVTYVVDKPQALAVIFALVLLGMFIGIIPSEVSMKLESVSESLAHIASDHEKMALTNQSRYDNLENQMKTQNVTQSQQTDKMIQIMRGMCLIIARQSNDDAALSYCNP